MLDGTVQFHTQTILALDAIKESLYDLVYGTPLESDGSVILTEDSLKDFDAILEEVETLTLTVTTLRNTVDKLIKPQT